MLGRLKSIFFLSVLCISSTVQGQVRQDSMAVNLPSVSIRAYFRNQSLLSVTSSAQVVSNLQLQSQGTSTLLPALNTVAGLRMEERSPGSYRLAVRGSLIRSPFGIRNSKIYIDEFPLTDAGGNTYLNNLDPFSIHSIQIIKGPDGSLFGANSGGVIQMQPKGFDVKEDRVEMLLQTGSYASFQEQLSIQHKVNDTYSFSFDQSFTRSDGYRDHTYLNRKTIQTAHKWHYKPLHEVKFFAFHSDLGYSTPGGLTQAQYDIDPRQARPASGSNPGAKEQQAGIYNKTFYGGIAHQSQLSNNLTHTVTVFGSTTDLKNPFITNYEFREENNLGIRTYFSYGRHENTSFQWQMQLGVEGQQGWYNLENFDNEGGIATNVQAKDKLENSQYTFFYRAEATLYDRWTIEGSLGLNKNEISYEQFYPVVHSPIGNINFGNIWMPRIGTSYLITTNLALRASISKGYSTPTIAEVRSSDNTINTSLKPETGNSYEVGLRWNTTDRRLYGDLALYTYQMNDGIIRQLRDSGAEYYLNAGQMKQKGLEASISAQLITPRLFGLFRSLSITSNPTYNRYRFGTYKVDENNFSGNRITAVPNWVVVNTLQIGLPQQIQVNMHYNYTSSMPLNDANTVFARRFHLIQAKASWTYAVHKKFSIQLFAGIDNLLNERYSLGNDINAFGGRFFNPAPTRNYYAGLKFRL